MSHPVKKLQCLFVSGSSQEKPLFYYGWIVLFVSFITLCVAFGIWYSYSVFLIAVLKEMSASRAASAGVFSTFMAVHALTALWMGSLLDRYGGRRVISLCALLVVLGLWLSGYTMHLWHLYLSYGVLTAVGICGIGHFAQSVVLPNWFIKRRGLAMGIALAGSGIGMQVIVPMVQKVIEHQGWRTAYHMLALLMLLMVFPLNAIFQKRGPEAVGQLPDGSLSESAANSEASPKYDNGRTLKSVLAGRHFWCLFFTRFATVMATQAVLIHQVVYMVDQGFSAARGAVILGATGMVASGAKILFGHLSDRLGRNDAYTIGLGCAGGGIICLMMIRPDHNFLLIGYAVLFGLGQGAVVPLFPARAADLFQGNNYGRIYGLLSLAGGAGAAFGSWFSGRVFDLTHSYHLFFLISLGLLVCSAFLFRLTSPASGNRD